MGFGSQKSPEGGRRGVLIVEPLPLAQGHGYPAAPEPEFWKWEDLDAFIIQQAVSEDTLCASRRIRHGTYKDKQGSSQFCESTQAVDELLYRLFTAQGHRAKGVSRRLKSILYFVHLVWPEEGVPLSFSIRVRRGLTVSEGMTTGSWGFAWGK